MLNTEANHPEISCKKTAMKHLAIAPSMTLLALLLLQMVLHFFLVNDRAKFQRGFVNLY